MIFLLLNSVKLLVVLFIAYLGGKLLCPEKLIGGTSAQIAIRIIVGIVCWSLLSQLTYLYASWISTTCMIVLAIIAARTKVKIHKFEWKRTAFIPIMVILIGCIIQLIPVIPSGLKYSDGYRVFGVNGHDGMWHVALQSTLARYPNSFPTLSGASLSGYHMLIDIWGSTLVATFKLDPFYLTFIGLPVLFSLTTGIAIHGLVYSLTKNQLAALTSVILNYTAGTISYLLPLFLDREWSESTFWSQQSISTFINLPLGASFAISSVILLLYLRWINHPKNRLMLILAILIGTLVSVKVYTGIAILGALSITQVIRAIRLKKRSELNLVILASSIAALIIVPQLSPSVGLIWEPGWFAKTMMEAPDRLGYPTWELHRVTYVYQKNLPRLIILWIKAFSIFFIGNFGLRILGFAAWQKHPHQKNANQIVMFLLSAVCISMVLPSLFLQKGVIWNTIQFLYVGIWMLNIAAGLTLAKIKNPLILKIIIAIVIIASMPTSIKTAKAYTNMYGKQIDYVAVTNEEVSILQILKELPPGNLLTPYHWTAYIPAISGQPVYFSDDTQAVLTGNEFAKRKELQDKIYCQNLDPVEIKDHLAKEQIQYVYQPLREDFKCNETNFEQFDFLTVISKNEIGILYKYD